MADKVSELTLSDLVAPRSDSLEPGYKEVAQARDDASSPTAQLIARRKEQLVKTFKPDPKTAPVKPEPGIVAPGAEPDARGVPAAPGEEKKAGLGHVESKGKGVELPPPGTTPGDRRPSGPAVLPSAGEVIKAIPGGVLMAAKRLGESVRDLAAAAHASGVSESEQELIDAGVSPEQAKAEAAASDPLGSVFIKVLTRASEAVPQTGEPESILGGFFKEAVSFLTPFLPFAKAVRAIPEVKTLMAGGPAAKAAGMALEGVIAGLPAGFISVESSNPTNLVNALPDVWRPAALEFLAAPPLTEGEEIALEARFRERLKSTVVGSVVGAPLDMTIGALIAARQALRLKAASRNFDASVKTALGLQEQRAGERTGMRTRSQILRDIDRLEARLRAEHGGQVPFTPDREELQQELMSANARVGAAPKGADVFHGTGTVFDKADMEAGLWVAKDPRTASVYAAKRAEAGAANVRPYTLDPKAKLAPESKFNYEADQAANVAALRDEGFDGVTFAGTDTGKGINYLIWNPAVLKEKFTLEIAGDLTKVTVDPTVTSAVYGKTATVLQNNFIEAFVRRNADDVGIYPAQMQVATEAAAKIERELPDEFAPLREVIGRQARQAFEDGQLDVPKGMRDDAGFAKLGMLWFLSRASAGALFGASGEGSMEDKVAGGLFGAGVGAVLSPRLAARLVKKMASALEKEVTLRTPKPGQAVAEGIAGQQVKPEADTFGSLAEEYAERVRLATRGETIDPETGLVKVRPRASQMAEAEVVRQQMTPDAIQQLMPTIRMNDSESIAMAQVMNEVGLRVRNLAITAKQGGYQEVDIQELLKEIYLMGRMDPKRLGALAEAGRTLGALNDPVSGMNQFLDQFTEVLKNANSTVTPQRLADAIASLRTPEELAVFARQLTKPGFKDFFFEVWINGLLSGPKTLLVNGLGNTTFLLYNVGERGLAGAVRSQGGIAPGEATAMLEGIVEAHGDALRAFWRLVRDVDEIPDASKLDQPRKAITAENLNLTGTPGRAIDLLGSGIRTPGRVLAGTDEYFKGIATRAQLRALAKREAFNEVERLGLTGRAALDKMNEIETAFLLDPPLSAMQQARSFAEYVTFTNQLGETGQAIQQLQKTAIGRLVVPFVRTPINLAKSGLERSGPLGLASSRLRAELNSSDPAVRDLARAKLALSSMTLAFIGTLAAKGYVTGGGPQDPVLRKQWQAAGYQSYSFDVGAMLGRVGPPKPGDLVSFNRLDPIAMPFGMMADVVTIMGHLPPDEQEEFATAIVVAFTKNFTSKTFVQGVARATTVMADPERMGDSYVKNFLTSATVPFSSLVRQGAQALDPELKDAQGLIEEYKKRIPGLSQDVPADLDLFGNPRFLGGGLGRDLVGPTFVPAVDFVVPIYVNSASKAHQDIFAVLNANSIRAAEAPESIDGVRLSNVERAHLKRIAGSEIAPEGMTMSQALKKLFASPAFKAAAPGRGEGREALVNLVIRGYYKGAVEVLQDRFKDLKRDVMRERVKRLRSMGATPESLERVRTQIGID